MTSSVKLLIIDKRVDDYQAFITNRQEGVEYITFDYYTDTYDGIASRILEELNGRSIESVALVSHSILNSSYSMIYNSHHTLHNVETEDPELESWCKFSEFWQTIGATTIDLISCALYMDDNWRYVLDNLEIQMGVNFRASVDDTGALATGANWVLESEVEYVNVKDIYFTEGIEGWLGTLVGSASANQPAYIDASGRLYSWGSNVTLFNSLKSKFTPTLSTFFSSRGKKIQKISTGIDYIAVLVTDGSNSILDSSNGELWVAGLNTYGQLGLNMSSSIPTEVPQIMASYGGLNFSNGVTDVACGSFHIAIIKGGRVYTLGRNDYGQLGIGRHSLTSGHPDASRNYPVEPVVSSIDSTPRFPSGATQVACGDGVTAVLSNGGVWTFGMNFTGELGINSVDTSRNVPQQVRDSSGTVVLNSGVSAIYSSGNCSNFGAILNGGAWIWGNNQSSQLGFSQLGAGGVNTRRIFPIQPTGFSSGCTQIDFGQGCCMIIRNGGLWGSGTNALGQLGVGYTTSPMTTFTQAVDESNTSLLNCTMVACGVGYTVIIHNGAVLVTGDGTFGRAGNCRDNRTAGFSNTRDFSGNTTVNVLTSGVSYIQTCRGYGNSQMLCSYFIQNNSLYLCGVNLNGTHFYNNSTPDLVDFFWKKRRRVHMIAIGTGITGIIATQGLDSSFNITRGGELWMVGTDSTSTYTLGDGLGASKSIPIQPTDSSGNIILTNCTMVACGSLPHTTAIDASGRLWTWGTNMRGQLGLGYHGSSGVSMFGRYPAQPVTTSGGSTVRFTSGCTYVNCDNFTTVVNNGAVWTFGDNTRGQLGIGVHSSITSNSDALRNIPVQATGLTTGCRYVNTGTRFTQVVKDNQLYTFGDNDLGQLGLGIADTSRNIAQVVSSLSDVTGINAGASHSLVLANGAVYSFGMNDIGQLGNGTIIDASRTIVQASGLTSNIRGMYCTARYSSVLIDGNIFQFGSSAGGSSSTIPTYLRTDTSAVRLANMPPLIPIDLCGGTVSITNTINYGQTLQDVSISYTGTFRDLFYNEIVSGTISFLTPSVVPNVGSTQTWIFRPDDYTYDTKTGSIQLSVNKVTPVQDVSVNVVSISFGQSLASASLSGSFKNSINNASVSGSLTFDVGSSTVPPIGTTSYNWTFRPDASNNYNNQTGSINVVSTYASDNTALNEIITEVITPQDTSASIVVTSAVFDTTTYLTTSAYVDPSQSTLNTIVYSTDTSFSFVPPSVPQNATVTTNPYRDISYNLSLTDLSSGYNVVITPIQPSYFVSPEPTKTVDFAFAYRVIDTATGQFVTTLQYPITTFVQIFDLTKYRYIINHLDTTTGLVTPVSYNVSGDIIEFTITKNNVLFGTSIPIPPATITLPFVFDLSAQNITVFGENVSVVDASFNLAVDMSASIFRQSLLYTDEEDGSIDISFTPISGNLEYEINRLNSTSNDAYNLALVGVQNSNYVDYTQFGRRPQNIPPLSGSLNQHFIQYIASLMFGHPQAQAPIKNDAEIIRDLSDGNLGLQFVTSLSDSSSVRHSMLEQLIAADVSSIRFDISDTDTYHPYPFIVGDKIVFRVSMQGNLFIDSSSGLNGSTATTTGILNNLFGTTVGIQMSPSPHFETRTWKVTITLV